MAKKKLENIAEKAAEQKQASAAETQFLEEKDVQKIDIIVCAYPGSEEKMRALWKRALGDRKFSVVVAGSAVSGETPVETVAEEVTSLAEALVADNLVADKFVLVAPNTIPTHSLGIEELATPVVYVDNKGNRTFAHRLPQIHDKETLTSLLAEKEFWNPEEFAKKAALASGRFPIEVGMSFGNFVTNVFRATPCENKVIEAFITKKFISCNPDGWKAIEGIVDKFLSE